MFITRRGGEGSIPIVTYTALLIIRLLNFPSIHTGCFVFYVLQQKEENPYQTKMQNIPFLSLITAHISHNGHTAGQTTNCLSLCYISMIFFLLCSCLLISKIKGNVQGKSLACLNSSMLTMLIFDKITCMEWSHSCRSS